MSDLLPLVIRSNMWFGFYPIFRLFLCQHFFNGSNKCYQFILYLSKNFNSPHTDIEMHYDYDTRTIKLADIKI